MISIISVFRIRDPLFRNELWDMTLKSYRGILETADQDFELIIIDNGSHDQSYADELKQETSIWNLYNPLIEGIRILRFDSQEPLAKAWNVGIGQADGNYIMLANNDIVYYENGWMSRMIEPFSMINRNIGIVGIQHMSWYKWAFVEGSLFVFPREFIDKFKLSDSETYPKIFDEQFTLSCEDVDFNARVQEAGYEVIQVTNPALQPRWLQHLGHRTIQSLAGTDENIIEITHENRIRLCRKYGVDERIID